MNGQRILLNSNQRHVSKLQICNSPYGVLGSVYGPLGIFGSNVCIIEEVGIQYRHTCS